MNAGDRTLAAHRGSALPARRGPAPGDSRTVSGPKPVAQTTVDTSLASRSSASGEWTAKGSGCGSSAASGSSGGGASHGCPDPLLDEGIQLGGRAIGKGDVRAEGMIEQDAITVDRSGPPREPGPQAGQVLEADRVPKSSNARCLWDRGELHPGVRQLPRSRREKPASVSHSASRAHAGADGAGPPRSCTGRRLARPRGDPRRPGRPTGRCRRRGRHRSEALREPGSRPVWSWRIDVGRSAASRGSLGICCAPEATTTWRVSISSPASGPAVRTRNVPSRGPASTADTSVDVRIGSRCRSAYLCSRSTQPSLARNASHGSTESGSPGRRFIQFGVLSAKESHRCDRHDSPTRSRSRTRWSIPSLARCQLPASPA